MPRVTVSSPEFWQNLIREGEQEIIRHRAKISYIERAMEIAREQLAAIAELPKPKKLGRPPGRRGVLSEEGRAAIVAAQRKRWGKEGGSIQ